ncbi:glycosyltransferase [Microbacterium sp. E-13]|uniref:glycosyltransferase n=1 Tax=Microbacterium sp. E-13 TaxID=3404048 RepID=UPI003CF09087
MRILFVTPDLSSNSLGRTLVLDQLAHHLGWSTRVVSTRGESIWKPLRGTQFGSACELVSEGRTPNRIDELVRRADLVIAVKPLDESLLVASRVVGRVPRPLLLDIDDPDLSAALSLGQPLRAAYKWSRRPRAMLRLLRLQRVAARVPVMVSNPVLHTHHGGVIVPHARVDQGWGLPHSTTSPAVAFVGTNRAHKGVAELRRAIEYVRQEHDYTLTVTDTPPADARPWERWVGNTTFDEGVKLVQKSDVVMLPSRDTPYVHGQLPVKLIDAMLAGRAIGVSGIAPLPWAVGDAALQLTPGSTQSIVDALRVFADPTVRASFGERARRRAREMFTISSVAPVFEAVVLHTVREFTGKGES